MNAPLACRDYCPVGHAEKLRDGTCPDNNKQCFDEALAKCRPEDLAFIKRRIEKGYYD